MFFTSSWGCDDLQLYKELLAFKKIDNTLANLDTAGTWTPLW